MKSLVLATLALVTIGASTAMAGTFRVIQATGVTETAQGDGGSDPNGPCGISINGHSCI
jgi:hypothetical protein